MKAQVTGYLESSILDARTAKPLAEICQYYGVPETTLAHAQNREKFTLYFTKLNPDKTSHFSQMPHPFDRSKMQSGVLYITQATPDDLNTFIYENYEAAAARSRIHAALPLMTDKMSGSIFGFSAAAAHDRFLAAAQKLIPAAHHEYARTARRVLNDSYTHYATPTFIIACGANLCETLGDEQSVTSMLLYGEKNDFAGLFTEDPDRKCEVPLGVLAHPVKSGIGFSDDLPASENPYVNTKFAQIDYDPFANVQQLRIIKRET